MEKNNKQNYIKEIAETKSVSIAAEQLGISQPALSTFLKKTENELGCLLFDRSRQPLELTEAGRLYMDYLDKNDALREQLKQNLSDITGLHTGKVTVGGAAFFNIAYLPKALARFVEAYPGVSVSIADGKVPELESLAQKGQLDLFITPIDDEPDRFVYEELLSERIFLAVPAGWEVNRQLTHKAVTVPAGEFSVQAGEDAPAVPPAPLTKEEFACLCRETFVVLKSDQDIGRKMQALFAGYGCRPARIITAEQTMTTLALTQSGVGVSLITESSIRNCRLNRPPVLYMADPAVCRRKMFIAYPRNKYLSQASKELIRILKESN
ncbi:MAG: LysR substrate-binding domain-containing protein [Lentihominibacter sp.]